MSQSQQIFGKHCSTCNTDLKQRMIFVPYHPVLPVSQQHSKSMRGKGSSSPHTAHLFQCPHSPNLPSPALSRTHRLPLQTPNHATKGKIKTAISITSSHHKQGEIERHSSPSQHTTAPLKPSAAPWTVWSGQRRRRRRRRVTGLQDLSWGAPLQLGAQRHHGTHRTRGWSYHLESYTYCLSLVQGWITSL